MSLVLLEGFVIFRPWIESVTVSPSLHSATTSSRDRRDIHIHIHSCEMLEFE